MSEIRCPDCDGYAFAPTHPADGPAPLCPRCAGQGYVHG